MVGRPPNPFWKANVQYSSEVPKVWTCIHCKKAFSGSSTRIRQHLTGEGNDIQQCTELPPHVREEALKETSNKRGQSSSSVEAPSKKRGQSSSSVEANDKEQEEYTTNVLVRFLMSRNLPVDVVKDPYFRTLLMRFGKHGVPSCLVQNGLVGIQKSLQNLEDQVNQYIQTVKESWKTTGCTFICYHLNVRPDSKTDTIVYGFYCPKGFIFVEGRELDFSLGYEVDALKDRVPGWPVEDITHAINHFRHPACEFSLHEYIDEKDHFEIPCVQQRVEQLWMRICRETGWVHNLIQNSEKVYHYMLYSDRSYECKGWRKLMVEKDADADANATPISSFTRLRSIMQLKYEIKLWVSRLCGSELYVDEVGMKKIINNDEFWCDGKELVEALSSLIMWITDDVSDNLVPTAGYLQLVIDKTKRSLKPYYEREASKYQMIWRSLYCLALDLEYEQQVAICTYLNPVYDWRAKEGGLGGHDPGKLIYELRQFDCHKEIMEDQTEKLDAEMKVYKDNNPFANLPRTERERYHPVELWKIHGEKFPLLKKYAIKVLSQPTSCMCNLVKKQIKHFEGEDNFILRLNYHMMQKFSKLGDRIYMPLSPYYYHSDDVPASLPNVMAPSSPKKMVVCPHIGQIPAWMNEFISKSTYVIADGNCGYRAIAESLGLGQDQWREVRQQLQQELNYWPELYKRTFSPDDQDVTFATVSNALNYYGSETAPAKTWLDVTTMGLLVASTFQAMFVVMGPNIRCTFLPLSLEPKGYPFCYVPEIVICHIPEYSHFISLSLTKNAPLPPVYCKWSLHHCSTAEGFADFLKERLNSYCIEDRRDEEMPPIEIIA